MHPVIARFLRAAVAVILAGLAQEFGGHPVYLLLAPVLAALGKWLRTAYGWTWLPV